MAAPKHRGAHPKIRAAYVRAFRPGQPCPQVFLDGTVCGQPVWDARQAHLGHAPWGGYLGLVHAACNERDGAQRGNRNRGRTCTTCRRKFMPTRKRQSRCPACRPPAITGRRDTPSPSAARAW